MDKDRLDLIVDNEREWRQYIIEKLDRLDKELSTFKIKMYGLSALIGGSAGISMDFITNLFKGG